MKNIFTKLTLLVIFFIGAASSMQGQVIFYEEDFESGPNGWTSVAITPNDTSIWVWDAEGFVGDGALAAAGLAIESASGPGSMVFNADFYTTQGDPDNIPSGPPATYPKYISDLISPVLDLTGINSAMSIEFTQLIRYLNVSPSAPGNTRASLSVSLDGGMTYGDPIDVVETKLVNETYNNDVNVIPLPDIQGNAAVVIKFTFSSDFYFWVLDDIKLIERDPHDMQANENFYAIAPNAQWPGSQVENFGFLCDIENVGGQDQTNVNLNITITDNASGDEAHSEDLDYGTIGIDSLAENVDFGGWTPPATSTDYTGVYTVSADSVDVNPDNNSQSFTFAVVDTTFAKDAGPTRTIYPAEDNWNVGDPRSWAYGNHYYVPNGDGFFANSVSFSIDVTSDDNAEGQTVQLVLYQWDDFNEDGNVDTDERSPIAYAFHTIEGNEDFEDVITLPLTDIISGLTMPLSDNTSYAMMMEFIAEDETRVDFGASDAFDYGAQVLASEQQGNPRYASLLGIASNLEEESYSSLGFGRNFVPIVHLNIGSSPIFSNAQEVPVISEVSVMPNPASDFVNVAFELPQVADQTSITLMDVNGSIIAIQELQSIQRGQAEFNVSDLAKGTYFVRIESTEGYAVKAVVVQ
jgi:hypothetical protein